MPPLQLRDALEVDDVEAMDPHEEPAVELPLELRGGDSHEMTCRADVRPDVVAFGLPPVDFGRSNDLRRTVDLDGNTAERPTRLPRRVSGFRLVDQGRTVMLPSSTGHVRALSAGHGSVAQYSADV